MRLSDLIPDVFFRGTKFECNICGFRANRWLPRGHNYPIIDKLDIIGAGKRWVDCKKCGSSDRDRLVYEFLKKRDAKYPLKDALFLHVAPEFALNCKIETHFKCNSTKLDFKVSGYKFAYPIDVIKGDIQNLQFDNHSFDFIICNHVLEHVSDDEIALQELFRVLKPGGFAILQVPISVKINRTIVAGNHWSNLQKKEFIGQKDHQRLYGFDIKQTIESKGFKCEFWNEINHDFKEKFRLNEKEFIILALK